MKVTLEKLVDKAIDGGSRSLSSVFQLMQKYDNTPEPIRLPPVDAKAIEYLKTFFEKAERTREGAVRRASEIPSK